MGLFLTQAMNSVLDVVNSNGTNHIELKVPFDEHSVIADIHLFKRLISCLLPGPLTMWLATMLMGVCLKLWKHCANMHKHHPSAQNLRNRLWMKHFQRIIWYGISSCLLPALAFDLANAEQIGLTFRAIIGFYVIRLTVSGLIIFLFTAQFPNFLVWLYIHMTGQYKLNSGHSKSIPHPLTQQNLNEGLHRTSNDGINDWKHATKPKVKAKRMVLLQERLDLLEERVEHFENYQAILSANDYGSYADSEYEDTLRGDGNEYEESKLGLTTDTSDGETTDEESGLDY